MARLSPHPAFSSIALFVCVIAFTTATAIKQEHSILQGVGVGTWGSEHRCLSCHLSDEHCNRTVYYPCLPERQDQGHGQGMHARTRRDIGPALSSPFRFGFRHHGGHGHHAFEWCSKSVTFICRTIKCSVVCCPGWRAEPGSQNCSIPITQGPPIQCLNGGTPSQTPEGPRCHCATGFFGSVCQDVVCPLDCRNNGLCDVIDGVPTCTCSRGFTGEHCETPACEGGCGDHGQCVVEDEKPVCACARGYGGPNCEKELPGGQADEKDGECPAVRSCDAGQCAFTCRSDRECPGEEKCCYNGCGRMCTRPANLTCVHAGVQYALGEIFRPDDCSVCTCLSPDPSKPFGGARCQVMSCPMLQDCRLKVQRPGECCPSCQTQDTGITVLHYKEPRFLNCPQEPLVLDVAGNQSSVDLRMPLDARDYTNQPLPVKLSQSSFQAGVGEENFYVVLATSARDKQNNFAKCEFYVRVRDPHPPTFPRCPPDHERVGEGPVWWPMPVAVDNVGLLTPPTAAYQPGDVFAEGEHPVVYRVEDLEGNVARCEFFVKVAGLPVGDRFGLDLSFASQMKVHFIAIGISVFCIIIILVTVIAMCRRRVIEDPEDGSQATQSGVFSITEKSPPPYEKEEGPPTYESTLDSCLVLGVPALTSKVNDLDPAFQSEHEIHTARFVNATYPDPDVTGKLSGEKASLD